MDHKKSPVRRKRQSKVIEENFWDCSVCTYRNTAEAFKCRMCDVRKGTSTRKPRLNSALAAQQAATLPGASNTMPNGNSNNNSNSNSNNNNNSNSNSNSNSNNNKSASSSSSRHNSSGHEKHKHKKYPARLKNVDRSTAQTREVTVNSVTVFITEYKPKVMPTRRESSEQSFSESNDSRS